jgi:hypothetical protein
MITINIDLGSAQEVKALVIFDHNLTSAATITLIGVDPPIFSEAITWADNQILHYLSIATMKRYWQLQITDAANPDGYMDIGELFLGSYMELSRNYISGFDKGINLLFDSNRTSYGVRKSRFYNRQRQFIFDFRPIISADLALLEALIDAIANRDMGTLKPFFFNDDSSIMANTWLIDIEGQLPEGHIIKTWYQSQLRASEVMRSI